MATCDRVGASLPLLKARGPFPLAVGVAEAVPLPLACVAEGVGSPSCPRALEEAQAEEVVVRLDDAAEASVVALEAVVPRRLEEVAACYVAHGPSKK